MDWECYADNAKVDQTYIGDNNGLDATLSAGRETQGTIYYEVPADAQNVELEYDINYWQSDKIIFVGKQKQLNMVYVKRRSVVQVLRLFKLYSVNDKVFGVEKDRMKYNGKINEIQKYFLDTQGFV